MLGCLFCLVVTAVEWFLVSKRTAAIMRATPWVGVLVATELLFALATGYVVFVQQNLPALLACVVGGGLGAELARRCRSRD